MLIAMWLCAYITGFVAYMEIKIELIYTTGSSGNVRGELGLTWTRMGAELTFALGFSTRGTTVLTRAYQSQ